MAGLFNIQQKYCFVLKIISLKLAMIRINLDKMPLTLVSGDSSERDTRPLAAAGTVQVHVQTACQTVDMRYVYY